MSDKSVTIRGVEFLAKNDIHDLPLMELCIAYFVMKAIEGDELAREIVDNTNGKIYSNGVQIYPKVEE